MARSAFAGGAAAVRPGEWEPARGARLWRCAGGEHFPLELTIAVELKRRYFVGIARYHRTQAHRAHAVRERIQAPCDSRCQLYRHLRAAGRTGAVCQPDAGALFLATSAKQLLALDDPIAADRARSGVYPPICGMRRCRPTSMSRRSKSACLKRDGAVFALISDATQHLQQPPGGGRSILDISERAAKRRCACRASATGHFERAAGYHHRAP